MASPIASNDNFSVDAGLKNGIMAFGSPYFGNGDTLLQNDTDADGDALIITEVNGQTLQKNKWTDFEGSDGGTFRLLSNGAMIFSSDTGFEDLYVGETRETTVTYTVTDADGNTSQATVTVTVNGTKPAEAIKPVDETQVTTQDVEINEGAGALFANDGGNVNGASVVAINGESSEVGQIVAGSQGGQFILNADGSYSFNPSGEFSYLKTGESVVTEVTYSLQDSSGAVFDAKVSVTVDGIDDAVVAVDDSFSIQAGANKQLTTDILNITDKKITNNDVDLDGDAFSLTSVNGQAFVDGQVSVTGDNGGVFTFYEDGNVAFDASGFTAMVAGDQVLTSASYEVTDADGNTASASVDVTIEGPYQDFGASVVAVADNFVMSESEARSQVLLDLRANDELGESGSAFISEITSLGAVNGKVSIQSGQFSYVIDDQLSLDYGETLTETFTYKLTNIDNGSVDLGKVTVQVIGEDPLPDANNDLLAYIDPVAAGSGLTIDASSLIANDSGSELRIVSVDTSEMKGILIDDGNGGWSYDSQNKFEHLPTEFDREYDVFTYVAEDRFGNQSEATVSITIKGVSIVEANDDYFSFAPNARGYINDDDLLSNDTYNAASQSDLRISNIDLTGSQFQVFSAVDSFNHDYPISPSKALQFSKLSGETISTGFSYTIENQVGVSSTATVDLDFIAQASIQDLGLQSIEHVHLNDEEVFNFNVNSLLTGDAALEWTFDSSLNTTVLSGGSWQNGAYHTQSPSIYSPLNFGHLEDLGGGNFQFSFDDVDLGKTIRDRATFRFTNEDGENLNVQIEFSATGQATELLSGSESLIVDDKSLSIDMSVYSAGLGFRLLDGIDGDGLQVVALENVGATNSDSIIRLVDFDPNGRIDIEYDWGVRNIDLGDTYSRTLAYTVVDENGNYGTGNLNIDIVGLQSIIQGYAPTIRIDEHTRVTFDDDFLTANLYDFNNGMDSYGIGISVDAVDSNPNNLGTLNFDDETGIYSYDPGSAFEYLNEGETSGDSFNIRYVSDDGSEKTDKLDIVIYGVDDPLV